MPERIMEAVLSYLNQTITRFGKSLPNLAVELDSFLVRASK
jgi:hypothetical protein